jgi:hypothetical protein
VGWHKLYNRRLSLFIWLHRKSVRYSMVLLSSIGRYWFLCNNCVHGYQLPWKLTYWSFVQNKACGVRSQKYLLNFQSYWISTQLTKEHTVHRGYQGYVPEGAIYIYIVHSDSTFWHRSLNPRYICLCWKCRIQPDQPVWINGKKAFSYFWVFCIYLSDQFTG